MNNSSPSLHSLNSKISKSLGPHAFTNFLTQYWKKTWWQTHRRMNQQTQIYAQVQKLQVIKGLLICLTQNMFCFSKRETTCKYCMTLTPENKFSFKNTSFLWVRFAPCIKKCLRQHRHPAVLWSFMEIKWRLNNFAKNSHLPISESTAFYSLTGFALAKIQTDSRNSWILAIRYLIA